jgi:hypothetical protein
MCKQPFTPPFQSPINPAPPVFRHNLQPTSLFGRPYQIRNAHPAPGLWRRWYGGFWQWQLFAMRRTHKQEEKIVLFPLEVRLGVFFSAQYIFEDGKAPHTVCSLVTRRGVRV